MSQLFRIRNGGMVPGDALPEYLMRLQGYRGEKGRPGNKKSPDFTGLFGLFWIVLDYPLAERVGFE